MKRDSLKTDFEQANNRGQDFLAAKTLAGEIALELLSNPGQRAGKINQPIILGLIAHLAPAQMIEMLFAPPLIATGYLEMTVVKRADPNFLPRRRNHQRVDPLERMPITNDPAIGGAITKPAPAALAAKARLLVGHVTQSDDLR